MLDGGQGNLNVKIVRIEHVQLNIKYRPILINLQIS